MSPAADAVLRPAPAVDSEDDHGLADDNREGEDSLARLDLELMSSPPPPSDERHAKWEAVWPSIQLGVETAVHHRTRHLEAIDAPDGSRVWIPPSAERSPALCLYTEKRRGEGEDAPPTFLRFVAAGKADFHQLRLLAVYDGLGGSGAMQVPLSSGAVVTHAFLASRLVRRAIERSFVEATEHGGSWSSDDLERAIHSTLDAVATQLPTRTSKLRSRMQRTLPTTLAAAAIRPLERAKNFAGAEVEAVWVGDSRAYVLTPTHGLQQLTADDSRTTDVLDQLVNDAPMTQVISAAADWSVATVRHSIREPFVAICLSDGVHAYLRTPGALEHLILDSLRQARTVREWGAELVNRVASYTSDDATLVLSSIGFGGLTQLRSAMARRTDEVRRTQADPFDGLDSDDSEALRMQRERSWLNYRDSFTALMPPPREAKS